MRETDEDFAAMQSLLDATMATAGSHLREIVTPDRQLDARSLARQLDGYCLLAVATASPSGRPLVSPVDGTFYRGHFYFSTGEEAVRRRHLARDPRVSATYVPRPEFAVTVHGAVIEVDHHTNELAEFRRVLIDTYVPHFGAGFEQFVDETPRYYRIDPSRMYCYFRPDSSDT